MKKFKENNFCFYLFRWLLLMISVHSASGACAVGHFGAACRYVCHCDEGSDSCDEENGSCLFGHACARGFHGDNCQKENVALDNSAYQSSTLRHNGFTRAASLAVDGNPSTDFDNRSCTHTLSGNGYSWWTVDLGQAYNIRYLRVYNREDFGSRLRYMTILIDGTECYRGTKDTPPEVINIVCASTITGQTVHIYTRDQENILTLCEVYIFVCTNYWFGKDCDKTCNCRNGSEVCDKDTGACTSGCPNGYRTYNCKTVCIDHSFGENCSQTCNCRDATDVCNKTTGVCPSGCAAGFQGDNCKTACANGQYGIQCRESCDTCATSIPGEEKCDHVTGQCKAGCMPGYKDIYCNQTCDTGRHGIDCSRSCDEKCKPVDNGLPICNHVTGTCTSGCQNGYMDSEGSICVLAITASTNLDSDAGVGAGLIAGIAIGCVLVIALISALIVVLLRRKRRSSQKTNSTGTDGTLSIVDTSSTITVTHSSSEEKGPVQLDIFVSNETNVDEGDAYLDVEGDLYCNGPSVATVAVNEGIALNDLWNYVFEQMYSGGLKAEYKKLPADLVHSVNAALKPENKGKSRYQNIYAYDHTRIILDVPAGANHTDYINANYIPGYKNPQKYIASQGATAVIIDDFWRMVWQENCSKIVALTRLIENGKVKCDQYWPDSGSKEYGNVEVQMIQVEDFPDFTIRTLQIGHAQSPDKRLIKQFHFLSWPDHGVPDYATALISFLEKVATTSSSTTGPIVVHCSAGIGRTGTFVGLDFLIEQAKAEGRVDVFDCINTMRYYRVNMIQTVEQYEFLYDALLEALNLSPISMASSEFMNKYAKLNKVNNLSGKTCIQEQFELLNFLSSFANPDDFMSAELEENKGKCRDPSVMTDDGHRVYLPISTTNSSNYINAVYLPTYKESKPFIITQMPLADTVIDFWKMIYDKKCRTIVMLNDNNVQADTCYWSRVGTPLNIGPFTITSDLETVYDLHNVMSLRITHEDKVDVVLKIRQFQCKFWSGSEKVPQDASPIIAFLNDVECWQQQTENSTIVVHCMNGVERSGVYCTISVVIDRLKIEQQVNILQTVKRFRKCRPEIISSLEQYKFCYDAVIAYLESFQTYSNFV